MIFGLFSHVIFKSNNILEDRSHWKSKTLKPVPLLEAGRGFLSREVAFGVLSTPSLPSANLAKEAPAGILWGGDDV